MEKAENIFFKNWYRAKNSYSHRSDFSMTPEILTKGVKQQKVIKYV